MTDEWWLRSKYGKGLTWYASTKPYDAEYKPVRVVKYSALEAERERSAKLINDLKFAHTWLEGQEFAEEFFRIMDEYEASRDR